MIATMHTAPSPTDPFSSADLGPLKLRNRFVKAATFEGLTRETLVSDRLVEFHRQIAAGGVALTTVAYCAVSPKGAPMETRCSCGKRRCRA